MSHVSKCASGYYYPIAEFDIVLTGGKKTLTRIMQHNNNITKISMYTKTVIKLMAILYKLITYSV